MAEGTKIRNRKGNDPAPSKSTQPPRKGTENAVEARGKAQRTLLCERVFQLTATPNEPAGDAAGPFLSSWSKPTMIAFILLTIASFVSRFYYVWLPPVVLFDEVHFVSMAQWYAARSYFFDIHPPLGKLCLAAIAYLTGFHTDEPYRDIGKAYLHDSYIYMRFWQAFWGSLLAPLMFLITEKITNNLMASVLVGGLVLMELGLQTISRAVLLDSFLYFCMFAALYCALKLWREAEKIVLSALAEESRGSRSVLGFWSWTFLCALALGLAGSIKHTALGMIGVIGLIQIVKCVAPLWRYINLQVNCTKEEYEIISYDSPNENHQQVINHASRMFMAGVVMLAAVIFFYIFFFYIHFTVIIYPGVDEDSMSDNYRSQLIGSTIQMPKGERPQGMIKNIIDINLKMAEVNAAVWYESYYVSPWYEWPVMFRGIVYHWEDLGGGSHSLVYLFGNPIVYYITLASVLIGLGYLDHIAFVWATSTLRGAKARYSFGILLTLLGWAANYFPYPLLIKRPCYMYHYHPSLLFACLLAGVLFDILSRSLRKKWSILTCLALLLIPVAASYFFFLPFSFATPLTEGEHELRRWFKSFYTTW